MKKLTMVLGICLLAAVGLMTAMTEDASEDEKAIRAAVLDYVEGIYLVQPQRIDNSIDVTLRKYGYGWNRRDNTYWSGSEMNFKQLRRLAANWNKEGRVNPQTAPREITILDQLDKTASAKLVADWGVDYFHLGKEDGQWKIINVLWQSVPKTEDQE